MSNFNSDDLLVKSQLLISKFRKQREASLKMQDFDKKVYGNYNSKTINAPTSNRISNKIIVDYDSFPQKDYSNDLLRKFGKQFYPNNAMSNHKVHKISNNSCDDTINCGNLSDSENSLWSNSTDNRYPQSHDRVRIEKTEKGIMTDLPVKSIIDDEDIFTPVTALPPTVRSSDQHRNSSTKENKLPEKIEKSHIKYSSICTSHDVESSNSKNLVEIREKRKHQEVNHKSEVLIDTIDLVYDDNNKMKTAMQLYEQEKQLENLILSQNEVIDKLNMKMIQLGMKMNDEKDRLNALKMQRDEIKNKRFEIVNGLSNDLQSELTVERSAHSGQTLTDRSLQSCNVHLNLPQYSSDTNCPSEEKQANDSSFTLDNETVRNIVDKIIFKEFSNTEDDIFVNSSKFSHRKNSETKPRTVVDSKPDNDDCVLSDVLSVKDLKISENIPFPNLSPNRLPIKQSQTAPRIGFPPKNPRSKSTKLRAAHSVDNLVQYSGGHISRPSSRKKTRSPAVSEILKQHLHYQSSSSDSTTD